MPKCRLLILQATAAMLLGLCNGIAPAFVTVALAQPGVGSPPYYQPRGVATPLQPTAPAIPDPSEWPADRGAPDVRQPSHERGCLECDRHGRSCLDRIRSLFHKPCNGEYLDPDMTGELLSPTEARWRLWKHYDRPCKHPICAYPHLFWPFEVYGRMSSVWLVGGGKLDRTLDPGIGAEIGIRQFLYDETKPAAWFGELGFEFTYHNGHEDPDLPIFTIREWNIYWVRLALGREWYFGRGRPGDWTIVFGAFAGGRFGSANTKFVDEPYRTDNIGGIFAGGHAGILIPRCGYDLMAEIFTEYGHDWTSWSDLITSDRHIDHIKLGGAVGVRY
ncbi:hypothetical protein HRbin36_01424 [bacterium HR36]|nr:hypothetical protein HRbin36_01424 [bacterium HR36]